MRVLYIQPGRGIGGSKISLYQLILNRKSEIDCHVALSPPVDGLFRDLRCTKVEEIHSLYLPTWQKSKAWGLKNKFYSFLGGMRRGGYIWPTILLSLIIQRFRIDLVHTNNALTPVGAFAAWITQRPHIWHIREPIGEGTPYPLIFDDKTAGKLMNHLSRAIICNSRYTNEFFERYHIHTFVVYNGLCIEDFLHCEEKGLELRSRLSLSTARPVIGMVGNLGSIWKEHALFLDAAALIKNEFPACQFIVFGGEADLNRTDYTRGLARRAVQLNLENNLVWAGPVADVGAMMGSLDILVHPTSREGSGRAVMESMAAGKPVVGIRCGGVQELIQDGKTGFLVGPGNSLEIAAKVANLLKHSDLRKKMAQAAKSYAQQNFSIARSVATIENIYRECQTKVGKSQQQSSKLS